MLKLCRILSLFILCLAFASLPSFALAQGSDSVFDLEFYSLNRPDEFQTAKKVVDRINTFGFDRKIEIHENVSNTSRSRAQSAFLQMVEAPRIPDGVVISGHHTGAFHGSLADGALDIRYLEKLACEPSHRLWFEHVSALWLQGCRTLGVGKMQTFDNADYHTTRVETALPTDHFEAELQNLNLEFSAVLDEQDPLFSRYLRVFPNATIFGWTETAPGESAHSENSFPYHIAHFAHHLHGTSYGESPLGSFDRSVAKDYLDAIFSTRDPSPPVCESKIKSWRETGDIRNPFAFDNPDLNAYQPLSSQLSSEFGKDLAQSRILGCRLSQNKNDISVIQATLDEMLKSPALLGYNYPSIVRTVEEYQSSKNLIAMQSVRAKLKSSPAFRAFVQANLDSKTTGTLTKIDIYGFYKTITETGVKEIEDQIRSQTLRFLTQNNDPTQAAVDFRLTLLSKVIDNHLDTPDYIRALAKGDIDATVLGELPALIIKSQEFNSDEKSQLLLAIARTHKLGAAKAVAEFGIATYQGPPLPHVDEILEEIIRAGEDGPEGAAFAIRFAKFKINQAEVMLKEILKLPKPPILGVMNAVGESLSDIPDGEAILRESLRLAGENRSAIAWYVLNVATTRSPLRDPQKMIEAILRKYVGESEVNFNLADAIADATFLFPQAEAMLQTILDHSLNQHTTHSSVAHAIAKRPDIAHAGAMLMQILQLDQDDPESIVYTDVARAVGQTRSPVPNAEAILKRILHADEGNEGARRIAASLCLLPSVSSDPELDVEAMLLTGKLDEGNMGKIAFLCTISSHPFRHPAQVLEYVIDHVSLTQLDASPERFYIEKALEKLGPTVDTQALRIKLTRIPEPSTEKRAELEQLATHPSDAISED